MTGATIQCLSHSANPAIEIWSWSSESNTRRRGTSSLHSHCARPANLWSWHAASNCGRALTVRLLFPLSYTSGAGAAIRTPITDLRGPLLFPLSYTSTKLLLTIWRRWGELHSRLSALQADALLSWLHRPEPNRGAEGGTRTRGLDVGNVASWPLDDFRLERAARVELASSGWRPEAPAAIPCSLFKLAGVTGFEPA